MGFLTPSFVNKGGVVVSADAPVLSLPAGIQADDILILSVETTGGQEPTADFGTWNFIASRSDGTGALDPGQSVFWHRYDGSTSPTLTIPDSGNHTCAEIYAFRNCERNSNPIANATTFGTTSGSTTIRGKVITPTLATGQTCIGFWATGGGDDHGGSGAVSFIGTGTIADQQDLRSYQFTTGNDGSFFNASARLDATSTGVGPTWAVTTALEEARISFQILAHEYTENTRSVSESLTSSDSTGRLGGYGRGIADALALSEAIGRLLAYTRGLADSVGFAESLARAGAFARDVVDGLTSSDSIGRTGAFARAAADALGLSDAVARAGAFTRGLADALDASDAVTRVQGFVRRLSDSLQLSEVLQRVQGFVRGLADSLTLADAVSTLKMLYRIIADALNLSDAAVRGLRKIRAVADALSLSDTLVTLVAGIRAVITAIVKALTNISLSESGTTAIETDVLAATNVTDDVLAQAVDIEDEVAALTDIEVVIE